MTEAELRRTLGEYFRALDDVREQTDKRWVDGCSRRDRLESLLRAEISQHAAFPETRA